MAIIKCKMCGGDLNLVEGASTAQCEYCGSVQTVPKVDDEKKLTLFGRANRLRAACEFDKAAGIYEAIVADFPEEAEAYWGLLLCKYGIEYVDDPASGKKIPTCHRSSFESILDDSDFEQALENADSAARKVYREEAKTLEEIRKGIVAVSNNEQPYDIFICYKETNEKGDRTLDSVLAQDVYDALTDKGYRVFFSRISLEDKLGMEYEPYIFAALNSAKIMLVFGTDYEYFNAVWVKNEWSRFLKLMAKDKEKHLIPCFKGIDAYDMPKEFAKLQAQDMGKVGAIQDLLRGIEKLLPRHTETVKETVVVQQASATPVAPLLKRAFMFLEDGAWERADEFCEQVLNIDPECAQAYLGKLMAELQVKTQDGLKNCTDLFDTNSNYLKVMRFADGALKTQLRDVLQTIQNRIREKSYEETYNIAKQKIEGAITEQAFREGICMLKELGQYKDAAALVGKYEDDWPNRQEIALKIWEEYCAVNINDEILLLEKEAKGKAALIEQLKSNINKSKGILRDIEVRTAKLASVEQQCEVQRQKLAKLHEERDSLGFIFFYDKRMISEKIATLKPVVERCEKEAETIKAQINAGGSKAAHENLMKADGEKIALLQGEIRPLNEKINTLRKQANPVLGKLKNRQVIAILAQNEKILPLLVDEYDVALCIKSDDELRYMIKSLPHFYLLSQAKQKSLFGISNLDIETRYYQACQAMQNAKSMEDIKWAKETFVQIKSYEDAEDLLQKCNEMIAKNTYRIKR